jgi:hypothetical protein
VNSIEKDLNIWWTFFPVKGFELLDESFNFTDPLFGDATIISKRHIKGIISHIDFNESLSKNHDHDSDITFMMENLLSKEDYHSLIAIRRRGTLEKVDKTPVVVELSKKRAYSISAMLTLMFLADNKKTCGLVEQVHHRTKGYTTLNFESRGFSIQKEGFYSFTILGKPIKISSNNLLYRMQQAPFDSLYKILIPQSVNIPNGLKRVVLQSAIRLSDAVHTLTPATHLLGAVTAIEIMLSVKGEKYDTNKTRIKALLGENFYNKFDVTSIMNARHAFVHDGIEPDNKEIANSAIALALSCLLIYAELAIKFKKKIEILHYLDFIENVENYLVAVEEVKLPVFNAFVKHQREELNLPFLNEHINKIKADDPSLSQPSSAQ